ncbi:hypothetical protein EC991_009209 [Linnemannia zychae]|nr:hypothetical protein EC991_009209 [Linnemannia zychae]
MMRARNPPIYTRHGYQPSILMGSSSKRHIPTRQNQSPQAQVPTATSADATSGMAQPSSAPAETNYIPVWLDSRVFERRFTFTPPPQLLPVHLPNFMTGSVLMTREFSPLQECHQLTAAARTPASSESSMDTSLMDWTTCPSSPTSQMSRIVPGLDSLSPLPTSPMLFQAPRMVVRPALMAFQQCSIKPELPFQGRSRSIFLSDRSRVNGVNSRVRELLHNTAVQRIRAWLLETIESKALEQWANQDLFEQMSRLAGASPVNEPQTPKECSICYQVADVVKIISECNHEICWKCEAELNRFGNVSCPLCRGMRLTTNYKNIQDLFATTIGLRACDYTHRLCPKPSGDDFGMQTSHPQPWYEDDGREERDARVEHELSDRYLWETSKSFLEHLASMKDHPAKQYFQLNAAKDLCFKSSNDDDLQEYNDTMALSPPTSGLVLPPHRLYIALIHFCLDMLTLPNPVLFQNQRSFKREHMLLELVALFLVPTDEFSPRRPDRIFNTRAWVEQGMLIITRIRRFMRARIAQHKAAAEDGEHDLGVPSTPISQDILYLGVARWSWIVQSMTILLTWIQMANSNPSMGHSVTICLHNGKHSSDESDSDLRQTKRQRRRRH